MDMPSEVLALPARAGGSGRPPPSTSCPDRRGAWSVVLCLLLCFLLRVQVLGLSQTSGAGKKVCFFPHQWFSHWCGKAKCLEDLEESLSPLQHSAVIPVHCIQLYLSLFWNCQSSQCLLHTPGPI